MSLPCKTLIRKKKKKKKIQETHMKCYGAMNLISGTNNSYILYYSGHKTKSENGVGIIIPATKQAAFVPNLYLIEYSRSQPK